MSDLERALDEIYDKLVGDCPDPRAKAYREEFQAAQGEARERFAQWERDTLDGRRRYHTICGLDKKAADEQASQEVLLLSIDVREELDRLIAHHWLVFTGRLSRLLQDLKDDDSGGG